MNFTGYENSKNFIKSTHRKLQVDNKDYNPALQIYKNMASKTNFRTDF